MTFSQEIMEYTKLLHPTHPNAAVKVKILHLCDITRLQESDSEAEIGLFFEKIHPLVGQIASVCVYPKFVRFAAAEFANQPLHIVSVANFPFGNKPLESVLIEISNVLQDSATEIDIVLPYQQILAGDIASVSSFVSACKAAMGDKTLKVILETAALSSPEQIFNVAQTVLAAGADFIKSSTGKHHQGGANLEAITAMLLAVREQKKTLKRNLGVKVSGGIKTFEQASQYLMLAENIMGADWIAPDTFRFGTSTILTME